MFTRSFKALRPRQNGRHSAIDIFKLLFLSENILIFIDISPKLIPKVSIDNTLALVQSIALHLTGNEAIGELMVA